MSPTLKSCCVCGRPTRGPRCPLHTKMENRRRAIKARANGLNTRAWRRLRKYALTTVTNCQRCGSPTDLTVHLNPELRGQHDLATPETVTVLCRSCHGTIDAPRAHVA